MTDHARRIRGFGLERRVEARVRRRCAALALAAVVDAGAQLFEEDATGTGRCRAREHAREVVGIARADAVLRGLAARASVALADPLAAHRPRALITLRVVVDGRVT